VSAATISSACSLKDFDPAPQNWTGFYVGGQLGYQCNRDKFEDLGFDVPTQGELDYDRFVGGIHVRANRQTRSFVIGIEADVEYANGSGSGHHLSSDTLKIQSFYHYQILVCSALCSEFPNTFGNTLVTPAWDPSTRE
jgi:opacity protein-like surface antigen